MTELTLETGDHTLRVFCECPLAGENGWVGFVSKCGTKLQKVKTYEPQ